MRLPKNTIRVALGGNTFLQKTQLKRHGAYWEASKKRWTIAKSVWDLIDKEFPGVFITEQINGEPNEQRNQTES